MKEMKRLFISVAMMFSTAAIYADGYDNGLMTESFNPEADSIYISQVRRHLDEIRSRENRPVVALVLCGGGAKGAAEVGAMRLIEEMEIPVDFICGTSIGSLVGGLYSVGHDIPFLDSMFRHQDWEKILSDRVESRYIPLAIRDYKSRYQLSFPFHYGKGVLQQRESEHEFYSARDGHLHLTDMKSDFQTQTGMNSILSSLPSGYVYGMNVNNMFAALTVGYHNNLDFVDLPIPFGCVATELVSCKTKNWGSGHLKTAMRSSMGIPGLFSPVRTQGMVLSDGGTRNNFPADLARAVGADIIIGIDLTDPLPSFSEVNNVGTILRQFLIMLVDNSHDESVKELDVYIRPDLQGYTSLSFNAEAVDSLLASGYRAALEHKGELEAVKSRTGASKTVLQARKATNLYKESVLLSEISFEGMSDRESAFLQRMTGLDISKPVNAEVLEKAVSIIQGSGAVESVTYSLLGSDEPYRLVFHCSKAPTNRLGIGLHLDTEVWAVAGLNFGWNVNTLIGPKLDINAKLGISQSIDAKFSYDSRGFATLNAYVAFDNINGHMQSQDIQELLSTRIDVGYMHHSEKLFLSTRRWSKFDAQIGVSNNGYILNRGNIAYKAVENSPIRRGNYLGAFVKGYYNSLDDRYCPKTGMDLKLGFDIDILKSGVSSFKPVSSLALDIKGALPCGESVSIIPDFHLRDVFDRFNTLEYDSLTEECKPIPEYSFSHRNFIGGDIAGRYIGQQVPFIGFNNVIECTFIDEKNGLLKSYDHLAVLNLDVRVNIVKNFYLSALGGVAHMSTTFPGLFDLRESKTYPAAGLQASYFTIAGPLKANFHWAGRSGSFKNDIGFYISMGFNL